MSHTDVDQINFMDPAVQEDWFAYYQRLREEAARPFTSVTARPIGIRTGSPNPTTLTRMSNVRFTPDRNDSCHLRGCWLRAFRGAPPQPRSGQALRSTDGR